MYSTLKLLKGRALSSRVSVDITFGFSYFSCNSHRALVAGSLRIDIENSHRSVD